MFLLATPGIPKGPPGPPRSGMHEGSTAISLSRSFPSFSFYGGSIEGNLLRAKRDKRRGPRSWSTAAAGGVRTAMSHLHLQIPAPYRAAIPPTFLGERLKENWGAKRRRGGGGDPKGKYLSSYTETCRSLPQTHASPSANKGASRRAQRHARGCCCDSSGRRAALRSAAPGALPAIGPAEPPAIPSPTPQSGAGGSSAAWAVPQFPSVTKQVLLHLPPLRRTAPGKIH